MSRIIHVSIQVLNDHGDKGTPEKDTDIEAQHIYTSYEDTTQDWELVDEINELAIAFDKIMGVGS